jgi:hypothetical protein
LQKFNQKFPNSDASHAAHACGCVTAMTAPSPQTSMTSCPPLLFRKKWQNEGNGVKTIDASCCPPFRGFPLRIPPASSKPCCEACFFTFFTVRAVVTKHVQIYCKYTTFGRHPMGRGPSHRHGRVFRRATTTTHSECRPPPPPPPLFPLLVPMHSTEPTQRRCRTAIRAWGSCPV